MKRLIHITPYFLPETHFGGPPQKIYTLAKHLETQGFDNRIVTFLSIQPTAYHQTIIDNLIIQYIPYIGKKNWRVPYCCKLIEEQVKQADFVHIYGLYHLLAPLAAYFAKAHSKPYSVEPLGMFTPRIKSQTSKRIYHQIFTFGLFQDAKAVFATSQQEFDELSDIVPTGKLLLRQNGVNLSKFENLPTAQDAYKLFGFSNQQAYFAFVGRIHPIKNLDLLLRAFAISNIPHTLILAGPYEQPNYLADLMRSAKTLGILDRTIFFGPVDLNQLRHLFSLCEFLVLPSLYESFGNSAAEAIAAGLPVLVTDSCGIAPLVAQGAGLVVSNDLQEIANGLTQLANTAQRQMLSNRLFQVRTQLSLEKILVPMLNLIQQA